VLSVFLCVEVFRKIDYEGLYFYGSLGCFFGGNGI